MRIITLLSDFGASSPYPAEMKGVLLSACRARLVDITHDVPSHDVAAGAYLLAAATPAFPVGTIHLAVVDPGVGTPRQALAVGSGGCVFVGPDNGLLMRAARAAGEPRAFAIDPVRFARHPMSATFHGRDLFAPAAAALARGLPLEQIGPPAATPVELPEHPPERVGGTVRGQVIFRDRFGNLITNIPGHWLGGVAGPLTLELPGGRSPARAVRTYAEGTGQEILVVVGSGGTLEIAVNTGSAADTLGIGVGDLLAVLLDARHP
ncbi:MAG: SAM-dependent chlorinase/fluorinase [Armatimonadota bacterium]|nr:SAM-dependent chlorinase/fluorinase [Armatimonadota bacterium]